MTSVDLLPGTLDLLILKALSLGPQHGYGVLLRIEQISRGRLPVQQGTLYPALYRLEGRGLLSTEWGTSQNNRRAKFYSLTACRAQAAPRRAHELGADRRRHDGRVARDAGVAVIAAILALIGRARIALRHMVGRRALEREMDVEFRSHIAHRADDLERRGLSREVAERAARVEFGGVEAQKDAAREARGLRAWDELRANVAFAARGVAHHPIQSLIVVTTLTLGLGISAVVFSVLNALAFRARVDRDAASFTRIFASYRSDTSGPSFPASVTLGDYLAYARQMRSLSPIAGWQHVQLALSAGAKPTPGALVTCGFFDVYGPVRPIAGRVLQRDDCDSRAPVAVIGNDLWHSVFGADPGAVGRVLRINGQTIRIVGIAPTFGSASVDDQLWLPYTLRGRLQLGPDDPASPNAMWLFLDGRLAPGSTRGDVLAEARVIAAQQDNATHGRHTTVFVTNGSLVASPGNGIVVSGIVAVVFVGLACLALVACASVVSILLAIADGRRTEMALRMALGAGAPRLAAMLGTESLMLAGVAGVAACALTFRLPGLLMTWMVQRADQLLAGPRLARVRLSARHHGIGGAGRGERADSRRPVARSQFDIASNAGWNRRPRETGKRAHERRDWRRDRAPRRDDRAYSAPGTDRQFAAAVRRAPRIGDDAARAAARDGRMAELPRRPRASAGNGERRARRRVRHGGAGERRRDREHRVDDRGERAPSDAVDRGVADVLRRVRHPRRTRARVHAGRRRMRGAVCPVILSREAAREWWGSADPLGKRLAIDATHTLDVVGIAGRCDERDRRAGAGADGVHAVATERAALSTVPAYRGQPERRGASRGVAGE